MNEFKNKHNFYSAYDIFHEIIYNDRWQYKDVLLYTIRILACCQKSYIFYINMYVVGSTVLVFAMEGYLNSDILYNVYILVHN